MDSLLHRAMLQLMFPGVCGLKSETGGILADIRALNVETIRKYHEDYYRPENLAILLTGSIDDAEAKRVLEVLQTFDERVASKGELPPHKRPWTSAVPPLMATTNNTTAAAASAATTAAGGNGGDSDDSVKRRKIGDDGDLGGDNNNRSGAGGGVVVGSDTTAATAAESGTDPLLDARITFASEDEAMGAVMVAWRGPAYKDALTRDALEMLFDYLSDSSISEFEQAFCEVDPPLAGYISMLYTRTFIRVVLFSCPIVFVLYRFRVVSFSCRIAFVSNLELLVRSVDFLVLTSVLRNLIRLGIHQYVLRTSFCSLVFVLFVFTFVF
jgi:hypothetical protein